MIRGNQHGTAELGTSSETVGPLSDVALSDRDALLGKDLNPLGRRLPGIEHIDS